MGLIKEDYREAPPPGGAGSLEVAGQRFSNAAAKFWTSLFEELRCVYPACTSIELAAPTSDALNAAQLHPGPEMLAGFEALLEADLERVRRETFAEMAILGPPASVHARVFSGARLLLERELPTECIDAGILPYMLVWILEWAAIPRARWNDNEIDGKFCASHNGRCAVYDVSFRLCCKHLHEGLLQRMAFVSVFTSVVT